MVRWLHIMVELGFTDWFCFGIWLIAYLGFRRDNSNLQKGNSIKVVLYSRFIMRSKSISASFFCLNPIFCIFYKFLTNFILK